MNPFNNQKDWDKVYKDIKPFARKLSRYNEDGAMDLIQTTIKKALEKQESFKGGNFMGWIVTIMKHTAYDENKKKKADHVFELDDDESRKKQKKGKLFDGIDDLITKSDNIDKLLEFNDVMKALKILEKKCRAIMMLVSKGNKNAEISKKLVIPMGTVGNRITKCRKELYKELYG